jgi:hypothetical protein
MLNLVIIVFDEDFTGKQVGPTSYEEVEYVDGGMNAFRLSIRDGAEHRIDHQGLFGFFKPEVQCRVTDPQINQTFIKRLQFDLSGFDWNTLLVDLLVQDDEKQIVLGECELTPLFSRPFHYIWLRENQCSIVSSSIPIPDCIKEYLSVR